MNRRDPIVGGARAVVVLLVVVLAVVLPSCRDDEPARAATDDPTTTTASESTTTTTTATTEAAVEPRVLRFGCPCEPGPELTYVMSIDDRPTGAGECSARAAARTTTRAEVIEAATTLRSSGAAVPDDVVHVDYEIEFRDLVADAGTEADAVSVPGTPHRILIAERHADEPPDLLVPIVAHELLHEDTSVNRAEEITAVLHETVVAGSVLLAAGDPCTFETDLGRRFRTYLLLALFNAADIEDPGVLLPGRLGDRPGPLSSYFQAGDLPVPTTPRLAAVLGSTCFEGAGAHDGPDLIGSSIDGVDLQALGACAFGDERLAELAGLLALATSP